VADILWVDVTAHYAAMSAVGEAARADILAFVNDGALAPSVFGGESAPKYKLARIHYAAHLGELEKLRGAGGAAGAITSKTVSADSLAVSYGGAAGGDEALLSTAPGTALYWLIRSSPRARVFIP
jgi:hypothetical protein